MMSHKFIKDPRELVKAGDVVKVKVLEVDLQRKRVALTMKLDEAPARGRPDSSQAGSRGAPPQRGPDSQHRGRDQDRRPSNGRPGDRRPADGRTANKPREQESNTNGVMAEALARAFKR
jgi:uncharacterized protein